MTPGRLDAAVVRRHLLALDGALQVLRHHQGRSVEALTADQEERWIVERGLQLCAQNALDIALLHRLLNEHLDDFSAFARYVGAYLPPPDATL